MNSTVKISILLIMINAGFNSAAGQSSGQFGDDLEVIWESQKALLRSAGQPEQNDLLAFSALSGTTILSQQFLDNRVRNMVQNNRSPFFNTLLRIDDYYGDKIYTTAGVILLYTTGFLADNKELRETGMQSVAAYFSAALTTQAIKQLFGRSRPYREEGPGRFDFWPCDRSRRSFPSGHVASTFALSTVMAEQDENSLWKIAWFGASTLVGAARIYNDKHWFSDIIFGGVLGYAIGSFTTHHFKNNTNKSSETYRIYISIPI